MHFTKLFNSILDSTVWQESKETKLVWVTMLAMCDRNGEIHASIPGLSVRAGVSIPECEAALSCLMSPDKYSRTKDHDGRRIAVIDGGWVLLNHAKYRALLSAEERREYNRIKQQEHRKKLSLTVNDSQSQVSEVNAGEHITEAEAEVEVDDSSPPGEESVIEKPKRRRSSVAVVDDAQFEEFWKAYPRRTAKGNARKAFIAALKKIDADTLVTKAGQFAKQQAGKEPQYIPHPASWLNGERWEDETLKPRDPFWYLELPQAEMEAYLRAEMAKP